MVSSESTSSISLVTLTAYGVSIQCRRKRTMRLGLLQRIAHFAALSLLSSLSACQSFSGDPIEGSVIDTVSGDPIEGVHVIAYSELTGGLEGGTLEGLISIA